MVDNNSQINKKDNDKNGKQDSSQAKGLSLQRLLLAKRSKSERSILEAANLFQGRSNGAYENSKGRIGEENGGREETWGVFASSFISTICVLNGRKVMPRILKKPKKINI